MKILNGFFLPNQYIGTVHKSKFRTSRIGRYVFYLDMKHLNWYWPEIGEYQDFLLHETELKPSTIDSCVAAVRSRYREMRLHPDFKSYLKDSLPAGHDEDFIEACIARIDEAILPENSKLEYKRVAKEIVELYSYMVEQFLQSIDLNRKSGIRNMVIIGLALYAGLRETEIRLLTVEDLQLSDEAGQVGFHVPKGPASTERFVPFDVHFPIKRAIQYWLHVSQIQSGPLIRGFYKGETKLRDTAITLQAIEDVFHQYPISFGGEVFSIKPFDLRRYYARMLHSLDYELEVIARNMGVKVATVIDYIGKPSGDDLLPQFSPPTI